MMDNGNRITASMTLEEVSDKLIQLANRTEELAIREKGLFSSMLKKWHPISAGVAAVTLHTCYGNFLRQFLAANPMISNETVAVLQRANKLEKVLVNMVVEDSVECEDGGKTVVREMVLYEVDAIVLRYLRQWIQDCLKKAKDVVEGAKGTEVGTFLSLFLFCNMMFWCDYSITNAPDPIRTLQLILFISLMMSFWCVDMEPEVEKRAVCAVGCGANETNERCD